MITKRLKHKKLYKRKKLKEDTDAKATTNRSDINDHVSEWNSFQDIIAKQSDDEPFGCDAELEFDKLEVTSQFELDYGEEEYHVVFTC